MNLIKHVFKKHLPSVLIILFAFLIAPALLSINGPTTLVYEVPTPEGVGKQPSLLVAKIPEDISGNPTLFDIEISPASPLSQKKEVPLLLVVIAGILMIIIVAYVVDIFYRRRRIK